MKINKWSFLFIIVLLITNSATALYFLVIKDLNYKIEVIETPLSTEDYGVATDGTFFIHSNQLGGDNIFDNALLIIPETDSTKFISSVKLDGCGYVREIVRMQRKGDYYFAKPSSKK